MVVVVCTSLSAGAARLLDSLLVRHVWALVAALEIEAAGAKSSSARVTGIQSAAHRVAALASARASARASAAAVALERAAI